MYKTTCFAVMLAALAGCSTGPESRAPEAQGPSDLLPDTIHAVTPSTEVGMDAVSVSIPLPSTDLRTPFAGPAAKDFRETTLFVDPGAQPGEMVLPVDSLQDAVVYLLPLANTDDADAQQQIHDQVLNDIQLYQDGQADKPLNHRAPREFMSGEANLETRPMGMVPLTGAGAGEIRLAYGEVAAQHGFRIELRTPTSPLALEMTPSSDTMFRGEAGDIVARVLRDGVPVKGAMVQGWAAEPNGGPRIDVQFTEVKPGEWRADLPAHLGDTEVDGVYNVYVRASGEGYDRFGWTAASFVVPTASVDQVGTLQPVSNDAGQVAAFEVPFQVDVASLDRLELSGTLVYTDAAGNEHLVARAQTAAGLEAGQHDLTLRFDAGHVALAGVDGPFEVRDVTLFSQTHNALYARFEQGLDLEIPSVDRSRLADAARTPAMERLGL